MIFLKLGCSKDCEMVYVVNVEIYSRLIDEYHK